MYFTRMPPLGGPSLGRVGCAVAMAGFRGGRLPSTMYTSFGHWGMGASRGWLARSWPRSDGGNPMGLAFVCFLDAPQTPYCATVRVPLSVMER